LCTSKERREWGPRPWKEKERGTRSVRHSLPERDEKRPVRGTGHQEGYTIIQLRPGQGRQKRGERGGHRGGRKTGTKRQRTRHGEEQEIRNKTKSTPRQSG